jgi:hypothetical protein
MPLTRRVQVYINVEASEALDVLSQHFGGITAAIEAALIFRRNGNGLATKPLSQPATKPDTTDEDPEQQERAILARAQRKIDRAKRKDELQESVAAALPARVQSIAEKIERVRPHGFHSGASPIPGCNECTAAAKALKGAK